MERVLAAVEAEAAKVAEHPVGVDSVEEGPEREVAVGAKVLVVVALAEGSVLVAAVITVLVWAKAVVEAETTAQGATMDLAVVEAETMALAATMDLAAAVEETMAPVEIMDRVAVAVLVDLAVAVAVDWAKVAVLEGNRLRPVRGLPQTLKPLESMQLSRVSSKSTEYWN